MNKSEPDKNIENQELVTGDFFLIKFLLRCAVPLQDVGDHRSPLFCVPFKYRLFAISPNRYTAKHLHKQIRYVIHCFPRLLLNINISYECQIF